ncbi:GNAT family N-acetyltransferase [uncultured Sphingomonas sp.]|uniref:GNAT family N-acetyltransferase n=1 Tax=uncultured Sphingomonas sp. TaxID=158754 RepID=UPI0035CB57A3
MGALKDLVDRHGEVKSMRTVPAHLRQGVGHAILARLVETARARGYRRVSLENGHRGLLRRRECAVRTLRLRGRAGLRWLSAQPAQPLHDVITVGTRRCQPSSCSATASRSGTWKTASPAGGMSM